MKENDTGTSVLYISRERYAPIPLPSDFRHVDQIADDQLQKEYNQDNYLFEDIKRHVAKKNRNPAAKRR